MASNEAERFMKALNEAEESGSVDPLVALFSDDSELENLGRLGPVRGVEGARRFWQEYLANFRGVRSHFHNVIDRDGTAAMEWVSEGTLADGSPIRYRGVSIIECDGGRVKKFRTYYDSAQFVTNGARA